MIALLLPLMLSAPQGPATVTFTSGARDLCVSTDGRIAFELNGDIWVTKDETSGSDVALTAENLIQLTSGPDWDREPEWLPDGKGIVFSSDRGGDFDLWMLRVEGGGTVAGPSLLVDSPELDGEPSVAPDGSVVFVRGRGPSADLWVWRAGGSAQRLTDDLGSESSPTVSPDGKQVAYVAAHLGKRELRVRSLAGGDDRLVLADRPFEHLAWAPRREVIAFTTRSGGGGVWVTPGDGSWVNLISEQRAAGVWLPDGSRLILAELPPPDPGYNGDPNRVGDRESGDAFGREGRLWLLAPAAYPDQYLKELELEARVDRETHQAEVFDRVWSRTGILYYGSGDAGEGTRVWSDRRARYRRRAVAAADERELQDVIDEMLVDRPPSRAEVSGSAAASSAHPDATQAGIAMLRRGGNVIDAAVAVSFALGVVEPDASGIGGYGEMVLYLAGMDRPIVIEFLSRVPEAGGLSNAALLDNGSLPEDGPVLANVPGTVAGMWKAWREYGSGNLEWADLLQPAIELAEGGFRVSDGLATTLDVEREHFLRYDAGRKLFFPDGRPLKAGATLRNPDLAWTLRQIADGGADAFYRGAVARRIVEDLRGKGNAMTLRDMARYFAAEREPVSGRYHGHTVYSAAPAAGGGVSLVAKLNLLDNFAGSGGYKRNAATAHAMIEAWKLAPRVRLADPDLWPVDLSAALDRQAAAIRWQRCFDPNHSLTADDLATEREGEPACLTREIGSFRNEEDPECRIGAPGCRSAGTTAFAVADAHGNMVAVTQTLGTWGGNFYLTAGLGFPYNDKLRSYSSNPDSFGARLPYARHGTSIAPTLVFKGSGDTQRPAFALGAAGNAWITSAVYQMTVAMIDDGIGPQQALELPRFLVGGRRDEGGGTTVQVEDAFGPGVLRTLEGLGHDLQRISLRGELRMGYGAAVLIDRGRVKAGGDPRRSGAAAAVPD